MDIDLDSCGRDLSQDIHVLHRLLYMQYQEIQEQGSDPVCGTNRVAYHNTTVRRCWSTGILL